MTPLPDWLVERVALDEVPPASRGRVAAADRDQLAAEVAALHADNQAELARYPAGPAVADIEARVRGAHDAARTQRRRRWLAGIASAAVVAGAAVLASRTVLRDRGEPSAVTPDAGEVTRVKGDLRVAAFRNRGDHAEELSQDSIARAGDVVQLRYNAGGHSHAVIASLDGDGVVTLHFPASEDAPPAATAAAKGTSSLPNAYALDDAPQFERFFIIAADAPIELKPALSAVRALARRGDAATAPLELPDGFTHTSLRLRKPSRGTP